jgi:hypothetical protein
MQGQRIDSCWVAVPNRVDAFVDVVDVQTLVAVWQLYIFGTGRLGT